MVSPDRSIDRQDLVTTYEGPTPIRTCEFTRPFSNENTVPVHYDIPLRYLLSTVLCKVIKIIY